MHRLQKKLTLLYYKIGPSYFSKTNKSHHNATSLVVDSPNVANSAWQFLLALFPDFEIR